MLISAFLGAAAAVRAFQITAEAPERIGPGQTLPQIWRDGGKKGIFLQRNKAFYCPGSFAAAGTLLNPGRELAERPAYAKSQV